MTSVIRLFAYLFHLFIDLMIDSYIFLKVLICLIIHIFMSVCL